ncbi:transcriptional protein SWT1 isoform X1 [Pogonomyrmex barbatus]|uniref:Transcriptional protein SWT1 isoform X1 n=1 Tax=Pogonomyrmex barbatus TaxID=144034 RepID=A0A6I9WGN6_9HYME|nr:transcriptional protein SWT1 isoform X1 [Pogonomyrmex barbatus]
MRHCQQKKRKIDEGKAHCSAITPEHSIEKGKSISHESNDKVVETPQMKLIRAKMLQRVSAKNKSSVLSSDVLNVKLARKNSSSKLKDSKSVSKDDESVSQNKKDKETPQMRFFYEKIQWKKKNLPISNKNLLSKQNVKQQDSNITSQKAMKTWEKDVRRRENIDRNKNNIECHVSKGREQKSFLKKNLAMERMHKLRRNMNFDKEKLKEICHSNLVITKPPQKSSKSSSNISGNDSLGTSCLYRNVEFRLKRLHNRIIKNTICEKNVLNDEKSQDRQDSRPNIDNTTKDKLLKQAKQEILDEEMDWEPIKDEQIALEVEVARTQLNGRGNPNEKNYILDNNNIELTQSNKMELQKSPLYIVVDTNVFLSNLEVIEEVRDATFKNYPRPFIVIPWTVICELDYFKDNKSKCELSTRARKAISFIHDQFSSKHPRIIGQTREQAAKNKEDFSLNCPDDEILQCCLQICQLQKSVVLLSYDKNLCTKAMIYNILSLGREDPLEKIDFFNVNNTVTNDLNGPIKNSIFTEELRLTDDIFENIKTIMKNFLSTIVTKQMSEIYGEEEWKIYVIIKPPWTIVTVLKCAIKHWIAAINESFQRCAEYVLKELLDAFVHLPVGGRKLQDVEYILEKCSYLVQMVNMDKYSDLMTQTFNDITELKKKCMKCIADIDLKKLHDKIGIVENDQEQEMRAGKAFQCFQHIYNYARDFCGLACSNAGTVLSFTFKSIEPPLSNALVQTLQPEITRKVIDLTQSLNKLLVQTEDSIKYQTLLNLQQNMNTFLLDVDKTIFDVTPLDIYYCVKLKEEALKTGLRQLQELTSHLCALATRT